MKIAKITAKVIFFIALVLDIAIFGALIYLELNIQSDFKIKKPWNFSKVFILLFSAEKPIACIT